MIKIVDYGMGNLRSVQKAFEKLGAPATICSQASELTDADKLVLPGVGAFRDAMNELKRQDLIGPIRDHIADDRPFLGICLGLQLLFDVSYEDGEWEGLGIVPGKVVRFQEHSRQSASSKASQNSTPALGETSERIKIPHMGWNSLEIAQPTPLLAGIPQEAHFYFVHSYYVAPAEDSVVAARTVHGERFVSMIARNQLFATQFHPEKSQRVGLKLLSNFAAL